MRQRSHSRRMGFPLATAMAAVAVLAGAGLAPAEAAPPADSDRAAERGAVLPVIRGSVGPGFTISVSQHRANPRRYRLVVRDRSSHHNWHIRGPGVDRSTGVAFTGRRVWRVRFSEGTYRIVCDPHSSTMRTRIVVS